jgi:tyrosyl-tRNA synthetase
VGQHRQRVELIRRVDQKPAFGLTTPLLSTASSKMGRQWAAVAEQRAALRLLAVLAEHRGRRRALPTLFTDLPLDEIAGSRPFRVRDQRSQKVLANAATTCCTGGKRPRPRPATPRSSGQAFRQPPP